MTDICNRLLAQHSNGDQVAVQGESDCVCKCETAIHNCCHRGSVEYKQSPRVRTPMYQKTMKAFLLPTSYVAYDLETSDYFPKGEIIEFGAVKVEDGLVTDEFSELCALNGRINPKASEANHITDAMLIGKRSLSEVFIDFCEFIGQLPLVGFNNQRFDDLFIAREAKRARIKNPIDNGSYDAMLMHGRATLASCCEEYGIENDEAHRALSDARATRLLYDSIHHQWSMESTDVRDITAEVMGDELEGQIVCFTGSTDFYPKRACQTLALAHGAELSNGVTKKVTLLVNLEGRRSTKVAKAEQYGISVIEGRDFLEIIDYPTDQPVRYDVLQTGTWFSDLGEETILMVKRELGLPLSKPLVYYRRNGSRTVMRENMYGVIVPKNEDIIDTLSVIDLRVVDNCDGCGMVTLEAVIDGEGVPFRVLAPYLADMQKGKEHYLATLNGSEREE